jgi:hypothetical protein
VVSAERVEDTTGCHEPFREITEHVDVESMFALQNENKSKSKEKLFNLPDATL